LISDGRGQVKIGKFSGDPCRRLAQLQTGSSCHLTLLDHKFYPNALKVEKSLHRKYRRLHVRGEWFQESPEITLPEPAVPGVNRCASHRTGVVCALCDPRNRKPRLPEVARVAVVPVVPMVAAKGDSEPKQKIDWSRVSTPGDVLKAIQQRKDEAATTSPAAAKPLSPPISAAEKNLIKVLWLVFVVLCVVGIYELWGHGQYFLVVIAILMVAGNFLESKRHSKGGK
jgi:hypothetical protein